MKGRKSMISDSLSLNRYDLQHSEVTGTMVVVFHSDFDCQDWEMFSTRARTKIAEGCLDWCFDLRHLVFINSLFLGGIVGFSLVLSAAKGALTLHVEQGSRVAALLNLSKLNRIINVREIKSAAG